MAPRLGDSIYTMFGSWTRPSDTWNRHAIDFKMIADFVRPEHTLVLELSPGRLLKSFASRDYILGVGLKHRFCWSAENVDYSVAID